MPTRADRPDPVVLVHGGGHGAWCWERMVPLLRAPVLAVDLPPRSIRGGTARHDAPPGLADVTVATWAASVLRDADAAGLDRFVLAGHSLGGLTIAEVARLAPERVVHLVFVSAAVPPDGGTVLDVLPPEVLDRTASGLTDDVLAWMFGNDMDDEQLRFLLDRAGTEAVQVVTTPASRVGMPAGLPVTYVRLLRDHALPPAVQDACIAALRESPGSDVDVVELDAAHDVMISRPHELAAVLDRIAAG
jgi:pimeloyl-ACP methyl ester carboxylesterase